MIVLDTNVVSELGKAYPNPGVASWFAAQELTDLYITAITEAELLYGSERLPEGRRRNDLMLADEEMVNWVLGGRVLPFDRSAAKAYALIRVLRETNGLPIQDRDCMIAAIACVHVAAVATRDLYGFEDCGVEIINPWETP